MFKLLSSLFTSKATKQAAKNKALRMQAFYAVHANPIRANGCYGWKLRMSIGQKLASFDYYTRAI